MLKSDCLACEPMTLSVEVDAATHLGDVVTAMYTKCKTADNPISVVLRFGLPTPLPSQERVSTEFIVLRLLNLCQGSALALVSCIVVVLLLGLVS